MTSPTLHVRLTFPPTGGEHRLAVLRVLVEDVTRADASAVVVGRTERPGVVVPAAGAVVEVEVAPTVGSDPARRFVLRVHGSVSGEETFAAGDFLSMTSIPVDPGRSQVIALDTRLLR